MKPRSLIGIAAIALAALGASAWLMPDEAGSAGVDASGQPNVRPFAGARDLAPFRLADHHGQRFDRERLLGRWTLVTFGFTSCAEVCPTMLMNLAELRRALIANWQGAEPQFVFITVDPARDTREALARYLPSFDTAFLGATGTQAEVDAVHAEFGGAHRIARRAAANSGYSVDHSMLLYVVDPDGRLHAQIAPPFDPARIANRISRFAQDYAPRDAVARSAPDNT